MKKSAAYTFIEISIIIIVLGIILGTIAQLLSTKETNSIKKFIAELQDYTSSINNFKRKYGFLPGDIAKTKVFELSVNDTDGNQNNLIEDKNQKNGINTKNIKMNGEIANFWLHLYNSDFLERQNRNVFPYIKFLDSGILVFTDGKNNFYHLAVSGVNRNLEIETKNNLTPYQAYLIDKKLDDGLPASGSIFSSSKNNINTSNDNKFDKKCSTEFEYMTVYKNRLCQLVMELNV